MCLHFLPGQVPLKRDIFKSTVGTIPGLSRTHLVKLRLLEVNLGIWSPCHTNTVHSSYTHTLNTCWMICFFTLFSIFISISVRLYVLLSHGALLIPNSSLIAVVILFEDIFY